MARHDLIPRFFAELRHSIESSTFLQHGRAFLPSYLKGWKLSKGFGRVIRPVGKSLNLEFREQQPNPFPPEYKCGMRQIVDYVLGPKQCPAAYCELETLDRAQLYLFWDPPGLSDKDSSNKLWHYYVTLAKAHHSPGTGPRYFIWLLVLPDRPVGRYTIWDLERGLGFFQPHFRRQFSHLIRHNPFRFYDPLIKLAAREFLTRRNEDIWFKAPRTKKWESRWIAPRRLQQTCELVLITITGSHLILSRGRDLFHPTKEHRVRLRWQR